MKLKNNYYVKYYLDELDASKELRANVLMLSKKQLDLYEKLLRSCKNSNSPYINVYYLYDIVTKINESAISRLNTNRNVLLLKHAIETNGLENALNFINCVARNIHGEKYSVLLSAVVYSKERTKTWEILELSRNKELLNHPDFNYYMERLNVVKGIMFTDIINYLSDNLEKDNLTKIFNCLVNCSNPSILFYALMVANKEYLQDNEYYFYAVCAVSKMKTTETAKMSGYLLINRPLISRGYYDKVLHLLLQTDNEDIIKRIWLHYSNAPKFDYHIYNEFVKEIKNEQNEITRTRIR